MRRDVLLRRTVGVVVDEIEPVLVEGRAEMRLSDGKTNRVGEALSEGASGDLDTVGVTSFRVTRSQGVELTELLEVVHRELVAQEVEEDVLKRAAVEYSVSLTSSPILGYIRVSKKVNVSMHFTAALAS